MRLPWVGWIDAAGEQYLSTWEGKTRLVVLVGPKEPHGELPPDARVYEVPEGRKAEDVAREAGGVVVIVFDRIERLGPVWERP